VEEHKILFIGVLLYAIGTFGILITASLFLMSSSKEVVKESPQMIIDHKSERSDGRCNYRLAIKNLPSLNGNVERYMVFYDDCNKYKLNERIL